MQELKYLLGKRIKELRNKRGLSQQQLSEKVNIDQRSLSSIECGNTFPSKSLMDISNALDVSVSDLFDFEHILMSDSDMKIFIKNNLEKLSKDEITLIYRLIKSIV